MWRIANRFVAVVVDVVDQLLFEVVLAVKVVDIKQFGLNQSKKSVRAPNIEKALIFQCFLVVLPGFEPRQADPESDVLPLHHRTMSIVNVEKTLFLSQNRVQKYKVFQYLQNIFATFLYFVV